MQNLQHPALNELQQLLYRHRAILTPSGGHRLLNALADLDAMHTFIQEVGGLEVIRAAMLKPAKR